MIKFCLGLLNGISMIGKAGIGLVCSYSVLIEFMVFFRNNIDRHILNFLH